MTEHIEFDAVVIGAGVVGLAIAKELCNHFDNVIVLDKESDFGQHVSSRHSGVIHSGIYYELGSLKAQLCVEGNELIYDYAENNNIDYLKCGKLIVGHDDSDLQKLRELKEKGTSNGVKDVTFLSPFFTGASGFTGGTYLPSVGISVLGLQFAETVEVSNISRTGFRITIKDKNNNTASVARNFSYTASGFGKGV